MNKTELWNKAYNKLIGLYGTTPDIRIVNRFLSEKQAFSQFDCITYFDIIGKLRAEIAEKGEVLIGRSVIGSSFVAYLLGATDENPLPPHYYCPNCKCVEFTNGMCAFDLPKKTCTCGTPMKADGFDIPFESYLSYVKKGVEFNQSNYNELYDEITSHITPSLCEMAGRCKMLERETGTKIENIDLGDRKVLERYLSGDFSGMPRGLARFLKEVYSVVQPQNYAEMLKLVGLAHGTQAWRYNTEELLREGVCNLLDIPTTRDEVFVMIRDAMRECGFHDTGFAYEIANKARKGYYFENGMDSYTAANLRMLGFDEWFVSYILRCRYLSNKALAVAELKYSIINSYYIRKN